MNKSTATKIFHILSMVVSFTYFTFAVLNLSVNGLSIFVTVEIVASFILFTLLLLEYIKGRR